MDAHTGELLWVDLPTPSMSGSPPRGWIIGAYAASPSTVAWDPSAETHYLSQVSALPGFRGLELPFTGSLHAHDEPWLLRFLQPDWDIVVSLLPGTMASQRHHRTLGLAATDESGRRQALALAARAREAVVRLNGRAGRSTVLAVEVHSAPRAGAGNSSIDAFVASLVELASWDWDGAHLMVEHCDAFVPGHPPVKGFLTLVEEIRAVKTANTVGGASIGMVINWGRSVLEARNPDAALRHVRDVRNVGLLSGVVLSGCSATTSRVGPAWADVHLPPAAEDSHDPVLDPSSLMTHQHITNVLDEAGTITDSDFRGLKVAAPRTANLALRIATVSRSLTVVRSAARDAHRSEAEHR